MTMLTLDKPIAMRMSKQDAEKLKSIARNNYCTVSTYCRQIIKREIDKLNQSE
jgi:predicted DNA-binding protein